MKSIPDHNWFGRLSLLIVAGYFVVGLWPFDFRPPNRVNWMPDRHGLQFEPYGFAYNPVLLSTPSDSDRTTKKNANFTVELWLESRLEPANNVFDILTIHNGRLPFDFVLGQWQQDFLLRATTRSRQSPGKIPEVGIDHALPAGKARFFTVRGTAAGTDFYLNGSLAGRFPKFVLPADALNGQLILGNDASGKNSWTGRLFGLALYQRALAPAEITRHYALWTEGHARQLATTTGLIALYLFNEGAGQWAQDFSGNHHDMIIPAIFQPIQRDILIPPWKDLSYYRPDYLDIFINIIGFVPFGFCFFLYRHLLEPRQWIANALLVILSGTTVSLTIELVQSWLPNRVSSTTDLLTNTIGTLFGVFLALTIQTKTKKPEPAPRF